MSNSTFLRNDFGDVFYTNEQGTLHREDGPAVIYSTGAFRYYFNGALHRIDGAASRDADGFLAWFIYGVNIKFEDTHLVTGRDEDLIVLRLKYGI